MIGGPCMRLEIGMGLRRRPEGEKQVRAAHRRHAPGFDPAVNDGDFLARPWTELGRQQLAPAPAKTRSAAVRVSASLAWQMAPLAGSSAGGGRNGGFSMAKISLWAQLPGPRCLTTEKHGLEKKPLNRH